MDPWNAVLSSVWNLDSAEPRKPATCVEVADCLEQELKTQMDTRQPHECTMSAHIGECELGRLVGHLQVLPTRHGDHTHTQSSVPEQKAADPKGGQVVPRELRALKQDMCCLIKATTAPNIALRQRTGAPEKTAAPSRACSPSPAATSAARGAHVQGQLGGKPRRDGARLLARRCTERVEGQAQSERASSAAQSADAVAKGLCLG